MQERTWPVDLGIGIGLQAQLETSDPEGLLGGTVPRPKASAETIAAFEQERGERLPESYREFLLHADGWEQCYFTLDLFGLPELRGGGRGPHARVLLETYEAEDILDESDLAAADVLPVAAGQGNDLVVVVREGRAEAGTVVWFDGGEYGRFETFGDFFEEILAMLQDYIEDQD
ncbi:SMI1/KNR4 family protein [Glycomyces salinus]|uniref:SMI1/KNR4 family protein n=1 Tax=Glycomyces salinus TaxID=980294 RepID=UPI0018ED1446|nr:SMI1/KNR4 family protein [Glycomyces salinus]